jgi:hypothetical protein
MQERDYRLYGSMNPLISQGVRSDVDEAARACEVATVCTKGQAQHHLGAVPGAAPEAATKAAGDAGDDLDVKVKIADNGESDTIFVRV